MAPNSPAASWLARLAEARRGSAESLGRLLEDFRSYLLDLAREKLDADLQAKLGASDLVQDSLLAAHVHFGQFRGNHPEELRAWLRQILQNQVANWQHHFRGTAKRELGREVSFVLGELDDNPNPLLADDSLSPSEKAALKEEQQLMQAALARLPEHYRQVLVWRTLEHRPFEEIGQLLQRSADAARMLWGRAVEALEKELETLPGPDQQAH